VDTNVVGANQFYLALCLKPLLAYVAISNLRQSFNSVKMVNFSKI